MFLSTSCRANRHDCVSQVGYGLVLGPFAGRAKGHVLIGQVQPGIVFVHVRDEAGLVLGDIG